MSEKTHDISHTVHLTCEFQCHTGSPGKKMFYLTLCESQNFQQFQRLTKVNMEDAGFTAEDLLYHHFLLPGALDCLLNSTKLHENIKPQLVLLKEKLGPAKSTSKFVIFHRTHHFFWGGFSRVNENGQLIPDTCSPWRSGRHG